MLRVRRSEAGDGCGGSGLQLIDNEQATPGNAAL